MRLKVKKPLAIAGVVTTIGLASVTGMGIASAQTSSTSSGSDSLIDKIASKFNLKKDDVKAVFDQDKTDRETEQQADIANQLETAVKNGKITATQKTLIENKLKELQTARDKERADLEQWASDNKINQKYLMMGGPHGSSDSDNRLQTAVDNGDITADQKTLIEKKQAELKTQREASRTAIEKWASDNKIDTKYLMMFGGRGPGGHGGPEGDL